MDRPSQIIENTEKEEISREQMHKKIALLCSKLPSKYINDILAINLVNNIYVKSKSYKDFMDNIKTICNLITKFIDMHQEKLLDENPKIKIIIGLLKKG